MDLGLKGKHILITGSSGGIGSEITKIFLENASIVSGIDTIQTNVILDKNFSFYKTNLEIEPEIKTSFNNINSKSGRIDALVLCHGFWYPDPQALKDLSLERWNKVLSSNLTATMLTGKYFFRNLESFRGQDASFVIMGSSAGMYGLAGFYEYASAKAALIGLMKSMKVEILSYASHGRVNMISPGIVNTSMSEKFRSNRNLLKKNLQVAALAKVAEPKDIGLMAVTLTSSVISGHITGENLNISGGLEGRLIHDFNEISEN